MLTKQTVHSKVWFVINRLFKLKQNSFSYSELVEIHRIDEATATPFKEGASLSE